MKLYACQFAASSLKKKKKKDGIQYISFNVKNTSAQKTDLRWEAMANICSVCSYGLFSGIAAVIRTKMSRRWIFTKTSLSMFVTFPGAHTWKCIHRCDVRVTSTEPVLHECPSSLNQSPCRDPSYLDRCGSFCSSSYSPFFCFSDSCYSFTESWHTRRMKP